MPREVGAQAVLWLNEATARVQRDVDAVRLLDWGREAEAFRTMTRYEFVREFPQHEQVVGRLDKAIDHAENEYGNTADRERFVAQARARLAERIAEGRFAPKERTQQKSRDDDLTR